VKLLPLLPDAALLGLERVLAVAPRLTSSLRLDVWIEQHKRDTIRDVERVESHGWPSRVGL